MLKSFERTYLWSIWHCLKLMVLVLDLQSTPSQQSKSLAPSSGELSEIQIKSANNEKEIHSWSLLSWKTFKNYKFSISNIFWFFSLHFLGSFLLANLFNLLNFSEQNFLIKIKKALRAWALTTTLPKV